MLHRLTRLQPWERRQRAEWQECADLLARFERQVSLALNEHDERAAARQAATRAAYAVQQAASVLDRLAASEAHVARRRKRAEALVTIAASVRREVRSRLLVIALAAPAAFAGWLLLAFAVVH